MADDGEIGRIVVADLYNLAFPMIRYDTGDTGAIIRTKRGLPILVYLSGRKEMDIIYDTNGEPVSPFLLLRTLRYSQGVKQWQFIQNGQSSYVLRISCDQDNHPFLYDEIRELKKTLGENATIEIMYVEQDTVSSSHDWKPILLDI